MHRLKLGRLMAATVAVFALTAGTALASPASRMNRSGRLTIAVSENPILEGRPLIIYGHLTGKDVEGRSVVLYHRVGYASHFTPVQQTRAEASGYYAFTRLPERVLTNRSWYVRSFGLRSATVHEHVYAQVTVASSAPSGTSILTGPHHTVTFSGTVTPANSGQKIVLQRQQAEGGQDWHTIQKTQVGQDGAYSFVHDFRYAGDANIRVLLRKDGLNIASPSSVLTYQIEQTENPALTIEPSENPITTGQSETISGTLAGSNGASVTLYGRSVHGMLTALATTTTNEAGGYVFPAETLTNSYVYDVVSGSVKSARLVVGVRYAVEATASAPSIAEGQPITLTGSVAPVTSGHLVDLQVQLASGEWITIARSSTSSSSTFTLTHRLFTPGTVSLRAYVPGGPSNQGSASAPVSVTVTPVSADQLPAAEGSSSTESATQG